MKRETDIRRGRHCVFLIHIHLVFVTKYRRKIFDQNAIEKLRNYFSSVCTDFDVELVEIDGERDHVHLLVNYPPTLSVSNLVNSLKGVSSRLLRRDRPDIAERYYYTKVFCGVRVILQPVAAEHRFQSSNNILNSRRHLTDL